MSVLARVNGTRLAPLLAALALGACGIDQGGAPIQQVDPLAGQPEPLLLVGTVTATNPLAVNGKVLDASAASVFIDSVAAGVADLAVGQVVNVVGQIVRGDARALSIVYERNVRGPVGQVDAGSVTVLGQTVVDAAGLALPVTGGIAGLQVGEPVEISGFVRPDGVLLATFVDAPAAGAPDGLTGIVHDVDAAAMAFSIGALRVDYGSTPIINELPGGQPVDGQVIRVEGVPGPSGLSLEATSLSASPGLPAAVLASALADLQPASTTATKPTVLLVGFAGAPDNGRFALDEAVIAFDDMTVFVDGDPAMLAGALVRVEGSLAVDGTVAAGRIALL